LATAPPTVTNAVPGTTGRNQPEGSIASMISDNSTPASQETSPDSASNSMNRSSPRPPHNVPPEFRHASP
jgi:hypothetical protein